MNHKIKLLVQVLCLATVIAGSTACSTRVRNITASMITPDPAGAYIAYWEGKYGVFGYDVGDGMVMFCKLGEADNALVCKPQEEANKILATKNKKMK